MRRKPAGSTRSCASSSRVMPRRSCATCRRPHGNNGRMTHAVDRDPSPLLAEESPDHGRAPGDLVHGLLRDGVLRARAGADQLLRVATLVLHGRAGVAHHLRAPHLVLRAQDGQARHRARRRGRRRAMSAKKKGTTRIFFDQLAKYYAIYTGGFVAFVIILAIAEQMGLPRVYIGYAFLFSTIALYATIGIISRTKDVAEYYVAGRRVPALFNGMATGADWMSAASFIGMAGGLYLQGFDGLAFIMGWTGGYCLVAFLLAPYLRKFGQFTIP